MMIESNHRLDAALAAIESFIGPDADDSQKLVAAKCAGLLHGYDARWKDAGYTALAVETVLEAPLTNPDTGRDSRTFRIAGKLDVIARYNGKPVLIDHKTTSQDITDPNAPYWRQLVVEGQVNHYYLLAWMNGKRFDNAVWDVVRKPGISPKKLSKAEQASAVSSGKYFGQSIAAAYRQFLSLTKEPRESLEMYSARLAHDCTVERPEWYFQRRSVPRLDTELMEYARELWVHGQEILHARQEKRHPRNSGACLLYGSPCKFLGLCSGHDSLDSDRWQSKQSIHPELIGAVANDLSALTNSRIRCFQTCRRKHQLDYELAIERHDEEEREALYLGSCFHEGLRAWWETFLESPQILENANVNDNCSSGPAGNELASAGTVACA